MEKEKKKKLATKVTDAGAGGTERRSASEALGYEPRTKSKASRMVENMKRGFKAIVSPSGNTSKKEVPVSEPPRKAKPGKLKIDRKSREERERKHGITW